MTRKTTNNPSIIFLVRSWPKFEHGQADGLLARRKMNKREPRRNETADLAQETTQLV